MSIARYLNDLRDLEDYPRLLEENARLREVLEMIAGSIHGGEARFVHDGSMHRRIKAVLNKEFSTGACKE
jgi:hypothetical protein